MSEENISSKQPLIRHVNRQQMSWRAVDGERLIGEDHAARAIWSLVGRLDLSAFYRAIDSNAEEGAGGLRLIRNCWSACGYMRAARGLDRRGKWRGGASTIPRSSG
jgi:hypothetical protein